MNTFKTKEQLEKLRKEYPVGTRLKLIRMDDEYTKLVKGDCGTVDYVDDAGQIHLSWDNGSTLALIPEVDEFEKVLSLKDIIERKNKSINKLETLLYNAIISWYDEALSEYKGIDDDEFLKNVSEKIGLPLEDCKSLLDLQSLEETEKMSFPCGDETILLSESKELHPHSDCLDALEYECWDLFKSYCENLNIKIKSKWDEGEDKHIDFCIVKEIQEKIFSIIEEAGLVFSHCE